MKRLAFVFLINGLLELSAFAQTESYDIFKFTPQPGWERKDWGDHIYYTRKVDKTICIITFYGSAKTKGDPMQNFWTDWNDVIGNYNTITTDVATESQIINGWNMTLGTAGGYQKDAKKIPMTYNLMSFSGPLSRATMTLRHNDEQGILESEIAAFMAGISVYDVAEIAVDGMQPGNANQYQPPMVDTYQIPMVDTYQQPMMSGGGNSMFPTPGEQTVIASITMDEGWMVEATNDYMQYTKPEIKVVQYFLTTTPYPNKDAFWQQFLSQFFNADSYTPYESAGPSYFSIEFASAIAVFNSTGQQYFIAWFIDYENPSAYVAITNDENSYLKYFPNPKDLGQMSRFNNFPVNSQDIQGEWTEDNFAGAQMHNVNTGNYAGMSMASASRSYTFSGMDFRFFAQGAMGMAGTAQAFQTVEKGSFEVQGYTLITRIITPKPEIVEYTCAFRYAKNTRVLWIQNKQATGLAFSLTKKIQ